MKMYIDPNEGWKYGFPKVYDPDTDGDMVEWMYSNGYPRDKEIHYTRWWEYREDNATVLTGKIEDES